MALRSDLHMNGEYQRAPWGYAGMPVRIYRPIVKGPTRMMRLYAMRSARGVNWVPEVPGITVSIGVVHVPFDSPNLDGSLIIDEADKCLYQAKHSGRNCTRYVSV